jgi:hypothetical protein
MSHEWYDVVPTLKFPALSLLTLLLVVCTPILASTAYAASADLTVTNVWLETTANPGQAVSSVSPGQQFNIVASIKNIGNAPASGYYLDVYYDSDYGRGGPDNITAGEVQEWYVGPLTATAGTHITQWVVDPDNQITETNESNNQLTLSFTIGSVNTTTTTTITSQSSTTSTSSSQSGTSTQTTSTTSTQTNTGLESGVVLLLGMDGTNGATSFPDSSASNHAVTAYGSAHVDSAQSVFGGASGNFASATKDYLSIPDSADWYFGTGAFTIDFWIRFKVLPVTAVFTYLQYVDDNNNFGIECWLDTGVKYGLSARFRVGGVTYDVDSSTSTTLAINTWYHMAEVRSGNSWYFFINGIQLGTTQTQSEAVPDLAGTVSIGAYSWWSDYYLDGWLDEFRVSKGIARWTANFTPPTQSQLPITATTSTSSSASATSTSSSQSTTAPTYSVIFYVDPSSGQISADGSPVTNGTTIPGYSQDQRVHIVASAPSGYQFASWEASGISVDTLSSPDTYMTVSNNGSVKAHFAPITYTVTFYTNPTSGTITVNGTTETNGLTGTYASGARVRVVANPPSGYLFAGWTASGTSVDNPSASDTYMTVTGSGSLKASFALPQVTVKSKSVLGTEFSGAKITVDSTSYSTPFSLTLSGSHKFTAPSKVTVAGVSYTFARWEDESGTALSTSAGFSYSIQSSKTFYAIYNPPQYSLTAYAYDAKSRRALVGASVYLDGNLFGTTNSAGYLVLKGVYAGAHTVKIHKDGYVDYTTTINLSGSTTLRAYLTRVS